MTARALRSVAVDWQVEVQPDTAARPSWTPCAPRRTVAAALPVGFAQSTGFVAQTGASTQTTGPGNGVGHPARTTEQQFPGAIRDPCRRRHRGAARPADRRQPARRPRRHRAASGGPACAPVDVDVDGVVDLPQADSLFQNVGAPARRATRRTAGQRGDPRPSPVAPACSTRWPRTRPDLVRTQIHAALDHTLPADPGSRLHPGQRRGPQPRGPQRRRRPGRRQPRRRARRRPQDAAYARVLFLFLGVPAAVLAALLDRDGRRRRRRPPPPGPGAAARPRRLPAPADRPGRRRGDRRRCRSAAPPAWPSPHWSGLAAFGRPASAPTCLPRSAGPAASAAAGLAHRRPQPCSPRRGVTCATPPSPQRAPTCADPAAHAGRATVSTSRCWPPRGALFSAGQPQRLPDRAGPRRRPDDLGVVLGLRRPGAAVDRRRAAGVAAGRPAARPRLADPSPAALRPVAGPCRASSPHSLSRQTRARWPAASCCSRWRVAFAASTATFNATYRHQAEVDAQLTNGADVTVTEPPGAAAGPAAGDQLAAIPGVRAVEPLQHRFAYIGADLQDLYGVDPASITARHRAAGQLLSRRHRPSS